MYLFKKYYQKLYKYTKFYIVIQEILRYNGIEKEKGVKHGK